MKKHLISRVLLVVLLWMYSMTTMAQQLVLKGVIIDIGTKEPLIGVTIKTPTGGTASNALGEFSVNVAKGEKITFSYVGYTEKQYTVQGNETTVNIEMQEDSKLLEGVVVEAGIIKRDKMGFTGAYNTVTQEQLKSVGSTNLLQSIRNLDPSFVLIENNLTGSNPNALPTFELRGQTSLGITAVQDEASATTAANQPLFILDGFEASLQQINDLDINRVASVTLLKDAGSTAIYGSKGGNGVVVIETIRPKSGSVFVAYNGDYQLSYPDLGVYNMMNAKEKLTFEAMAGRYGDLSRPVSNLSPYDHQVLFYERLGWVLQGRDTYWLSEPVRVAFTHKHSVTVSGGEGKLLFDAGLSYKQNPGVMKGSERDTYGGNLRLVYRGFENLNISNNISVQGTNADEGSWGSFANFVNANPYYLKRNADGSTPKYLDEFPGIDSSINPLYNASLSSYDNSDIMLVINNTQLDWSVTRALKIIANMGIQYESTNRAVFKDPRHSDFDGDSFEKRGTYDGSRTKNWSYNANLSANYLKSFGLNNITLIGRYNIYQLTTTSEAYSAIGFPEGAVGYPSYAYSYTPDGRPYYETNMDRQLGVLGAFNYNYDFRYLLDVNYNVDGSTRFGQNKRFQGFWSVGLGWNVHREAFAKDWHWLDNLKIRATYGTNGNQNVDVVSSSVAQYYLGTTIFGQAGYFSEIGNPNLRWQVVKKLGGGFDLDILKRLTLHFDVYQHMTDPQVVKLPERPSSGLSSYDVNMGWMKTSGIEFSVAYSVIDTKDWYLNLRAMGARNRSVYGGFSDALKELNDAYITSANNDSEAKLSLNSLQKYEDGRSPYDLWAVPSLGIDPADGLEVFQTKDGKPTKIYNWDDRVVVANSRPDIEGVLGFTLRYKKLMLNSSFRYRLGASAYNTALFNKVENITSTNIVYNQDKRALYDRWQKSGDIAQFKAINLISARPIQAETPVSSRFIQRDNYLKGEALKLTYNFTGEAWLNTLKLKDLSVSFSMQNFFDLTSIKIERGIDYPFERAVLMNVAARF